MIPDHYPLDSDGARQPPDLASDPGLRDEHKLAEAIDNLADAVREAAVTIGEALIVTQVAQRRDQLADELRAEHARPTPPRGSD